MLKWDAEHSERKAVSVATKKDSKPDEPPPRLARGPVRVSTFIGRLTRPALGARGLAGADILSQWSVIVGPELAALASPQSLKGDRPGRGTDGQGGTLTLRVASSGAATILQLKGPQIVERINRFFGYRAVARLQVVPGSSSGLTKPATKADPPLPSDVLSQIDDAVAAVGEPDLRAALARLGAAVRRRRLAESED